MKSNKKSKKNKGLLKIVLLLAVIVAVLFALQAMKNSRSLPRLGAQIESVAQPQQEEAPSPEFVDPREIKDALRQMADIRREIKRLVSQARKSPGLASDLSRLNEISGQLDNFAKNVKNPSPEMSQREALQEFYDARVWDEINGLRAKIEFPREIKNLETELKRTERLVAIKSFQKTGLDMEAIRAKINEIKSTIAEARKNYNDGALEEAMESLEPIHQGTHPGDIACVLYSFKDIGQMLTRVKDPQVKSMLQEIFDPITEAIKEGDYRDACRTLNDELRPEMEKIMRLVLGSKTLNPKVKDKLQKLEDIVRQKFEKTEQPAPIPTQEIE